MNGNKQNMKPEAGKSNNKKKMIIAGVIAGIIMLVIIIIAGVVMYNNIKGNKSFSGINATSEEGNYVSLREGVVSEKDASKIRKNLVSMNEDQGIYTLVYRRKVPDMFGKLKEGNIFCVFPNKDETKSYLAMGFSGKYISTSMTGNKYSVQFTIPDFKEVFSDISIDMEKISLDSQKTAFIPEDNVEVKELKKSGFSFPINMDLLATKVKDEITIGKNTAGFEFRNASKTSLRPDYKLLCDSLKLSIKNKQEENFADVTIGGEVTFDNPAIKYVMDYHYDEKKDKVTVNKFDMGFITNQKVKLTLKADKEVTLDDFKFKKKSNNHILEIDDVTDSEKGKTVLGTYVIGFNVDLKNPLTGKNMLQNSKNKVSYLSFGIAIQFTLTARGEVEMKYSYEESGFLKAEVNSKGKNDVVVKSYDYPNPVVSNDKPTDEQEASKPNVSMEIEGKIDADLAIGADAGICILGLIPMKLAINCPEAELGYSFKYKQESNKEEEVVKDSYILDDNIDYLMVSTNGKLKMHLGAKVNLGEIKDYTLAEGGLEMQAFKNVIMQYPKPKMFSHEECGFGGIYTNENYDDEKLKNDYEEFTKEYCKKSGGIIKDVKKQTLKSFTGNLSSELGYAVEDMIKAIGIDINSYKTDFYDGVIYLRDNNNRVVAELVTDENIINRTGVHNGMKIKKIEQTYSAPKESYSAELKIGTFLRTILGIKDISDMELTQYIYYSKDSNERMDLIFDDENLKLIVVSVR